MSTDVVVKKLMMFESFGGDGGGDGERCSSKCGITIKRNARGSSTRSNFRDRCMSRKTQLSSFSTFTNQNRRASCSDEEMGSVMMMRRRRGNERTIDLSIGNRIRRDWSNSRITSTSKAFLHNFPVFVIVFLTMMNFARVVESIPAATVENLDSKIKMFLESHCTMQNQTLEQEEFKSFMSCGPSHGAGIVKNLERIPEYKSDDMDLWARATKREIISQCEVWPQNRTCQETTFRLIEKCFEKDQKFIFYFMFALTDVICQSEQSDLFVKFWQNGGDACLGNHLKTLKKDWSECFEKTSTVSNADVYSNLDDVMQCFKSQFDNECLGEGSDGVLNEIMAEIRKVYLETMKSSRSSTGILQVARFPIIFLTGWMTFLLQQLLLQ